MNDKELREIRRRFRPEKNNIMGIRGCFVNDRNEIVSEFYQPMLQCSQEESEKLLAIMKKSISGGLGSNLIDIRFETKQVMESEEHALLMKLKNSELKDEEAVHTFFQKVIETIRIDGNYVILLASDNYDVFSHNADGTKGESTEVYSYIVCSVCPLKPMKAALSFRNFDNTFHAVSADFLLCPPELGFLFPAFDDRRANIYNALYYTRDISQIYPEFIERIFNTPLPMPATEQKATFESCLMETLQEECDYETLRSVHTQISEMVQEHKETKQEEPLTLSKRKFKEVLEGCGVSEEKVEHFTKKYEEQFGENAEVAPSNIVDVKRFEVTLPDVTIKVNPERNHLISTQIINGIKYIMIQATEGVEVNGVNINIK